MIPTAPEPTPGTPDDRRDATTGHAMWRDYRRRHRWWLQLVTIAVLVVAAVAWPVVIVWTLARDWRLRRAIARLAFPSAPAGADMAGD